MDTTTAPVRQRPRVTLWLLRAVVTVHLAAVVVQPVLAGLYLGGDVDAIGWHAAIGSATAALGLAVIAASLAYVVAARGRPWPLLVVAVLLFLTEGLQIGFGYAHQLGLHVPLGVAVVLAAVALAGWAWRGAR